MHEIFFLENTTSQSPTDGTVLGRGEWNFALEVIGGDAASILIEKKRPGSSIWRKVVDGMGVLSLTGDNPDFMEASVGHTYRVTRSLGSAPCTVYASKFAFRTQSCYT